MTRSAWVGPAPRKPIGRCRVCGDTCDLNMGDQGVIASLHRPIRPGPVGPAGYCAGSLKASVDFDVDQLTTWRRYLSVCHRGRKSPSKSRRRMRSA